MINWKSILSSFNDKPTLLEWLKLVEKALKESVLTNVLTDTKDGKTSFIFKFEDGTEISTDYVQTKGDKGDPGSTSITGVEEVSDEVIGNQTATTLRIYLSDGTFNDVVVYAKNGSDVNLKTRTKLLTNADFSISQGEFTVISSTLLLTYNDDYSIVNLSGRIVLNVSATVSGAIAVKINIDPAKILRNYSNSQASIGFAYKENFFEGLTCGVLKNDGLIVKNRATYNNLSNGEVVFEVNATFFLKEA